MSDTSSIFHEDQPKSRPGALETAVSVERDIGRIEGALKAHEDRMDRTDNSVSHLAISVNSRFDGVKLHLDKQDEKLDTLILRTAKEDGASSQKRFRFENTVNFWVMAGAAAAVVSTLGELMGHYLIVSLTHVVAGH